MAARLTPATQTVPLAGLAANHTGPTVDGDVVEVGRGVFLSVINGSAAPITVTIQTPETVDGDLTLSDRVVTVPVSTTPKLIPLTSNHYRQPVGDANAGKALVDYSAVATVTRAVVKIA